MKKLILKIVVVFFIGASIYAQDSSSETDSIKNERSFLKGLKKTQASKDGESKMNIDIMNVPLNTEDGIKHPRCQMFFLDTDLTQ